MLQQSDHMAKTKPKTFKDIPAGPRPGVVEAYLRAFVYKRDTEKLKGVMTSEEIRIAKLKTRELKRM